MKMRLRRLEADRRDVEGEFAQHPLIRVTEATGTPPEKYRFEIRVAGLRETEQGEYARVDSHGVEVFLPMDYPQRPPFCRMTTPVFHPNIDPQKICIGDHWSAGQSLPDLVIQIAQMIAYQSYNVKSPLNAKAAAWVENNLERLPLEKADLTAS